MVSANHTVRVMVGDDSAVSILTADIDTLSTYGIIVHVFWIFGILLMAAHHVSEEAPSLRWEHVRTFAKELVTNDDFSNQRHLVAASLLGTLRSILQRLHAPMFWPPMNDPGTHVLAGLAAIVLCRSLSVSAGMRRQLAVGVIVMGIFIPMVLFTMLSSTSTLYTQEWDAPPLDPGDDAGGSDTDGSGATNEFSTFVWPGCRLMLSASVFVQGIALYRSANLLNSDEFVTKHRSYSNYLLRMVAIQAMWTLYSWMAFMSPTCKEPPTNGNPRVHMREQSTYTLYALRATFAVVELVVSTDFVWHAEKL